jgi:hypothetical protein
LYANPIAAASPGELLLLDAAGAYLLFCFRLKLLLLLHLLLGQRQELDLDARGCALGVERAD